jgi:riboflavin kinase/FMN adenylyltransferase
MKIFRGHQHPALAQPCALTIGNFDGVHRGHQAMLAVLKNEAKHRGLPARVMTFEPHPREYFFPGTAPTRISTLRDKLTELARCGIDQAVVLPFNARLASQSAEAFIRDVLLNNLQVRYMLVGDDFRFGSKRAGDYAMLDAAGIAGGFEVARMDSYEVHGARVSSSAVRAALAYGQMDDAARLLGHPYSISGHVVHGKKLGRELGFRTLNIAFRHDKPAASGIFVVRTHGLGAQGDAPVDGVASLGIRPTVEDAGRVLLEVHCLDWTPTLATSHTALPPEGAGLDSAYGKIIRVELLHKLHDELKYEGLEALQKGIARDCDNARAFFAAQRTETSLDRI